MDYFRIGVVGTNKSQKHKFINSLFQDNLYPNNVVKKQSYVLLFRDSKIPKSILRKVEPQIGNGKFVGWKVKEEFLASSPDIPKYLEYFTDNIVGNGDYEETTFLIETSNSKIKTKCYPLQVYDIPKIRSESDNGCILIEDSQPVQQQIDIIVVVLSLSDCFKENYINVQRILGNTKTAKVWVVVGQGVSQQDIPFVGQNNKLLIGNNVDSLIGDLQKIIQQIQQQCIEKQQKMVCYMRPKQIVSVQQQPLTPQQSQTTKIIPTKSHQSQQQVPTQPTLLRSISTNKVPLFLSKKQISQLSSQQLSNIISLLQVDVSKYTVQQYNSHLKQIGYNRFVSFPPLSFKSQLVCLVVLLIVSLLLQSFWISIVALIFVSISAMSRAFNNKKNNRDLFDQSVKRNKIVLYGREGIVTEKINEINEELKSRG